MRTLTRFLLAATVVAAPLGAQKPGAFPTNDPVLQRIWRIGMDSSWTTKLSEQLFDSIGPRLTASPGHRNAANWVVKNYKAWGIDGQIENYGTWRGWDRGVSHVDLMQPRVRSLEAQMLAWSPGTNGVPVNAEAIILPKFADSTEFVKWLPQAKGKIVMLSPSYPTCRPAQDWDEFATPESRARIDSVMAAIARDWQSSPDSNKLYRGTGYSMGLGTGTLGMRLEKAGVLGMLTSRTKLAAGFGQGGRGGGGGGRGGRGGAGPTMRGGGTSSAIQQEMAGRGGRGAAGWGVIEVFETYNTKAPAIGMVCEDYGLVYRLAENKQKPMVRIETTAKLLGEVPTFNVLGTMKGSEKADEYVMLSAHFDSWDGGSGATDNGTGTLLAMEAMRILSMAYPHPKRTIRAGHWASEEQGLNGSRAYAEDHKNDVVAKIQAIFNQDNGTGRVQSISASGLTDMGKHLKQWYEKLPGFYTDSTSYNAVGWSFNDVAAGNPGGTDGTVFACHGAPHFGLGAVGWNYSTYTWHTNRDTYDKVVQDDLKHNATLAAMMVYLASEDPEFISRTKSPGNWPADCGAAPRKTKPRF